ncbi:MAG: glycosyltransferase family protein [Dongiaceae bacterium]
MSQPRPSSLRFLFYSHDGMGLGHTRRNLAIAAALVDLCPQALVLLACSTDDAHRLGLPPRVEVLKLPGLRKTANDQYLSRRLPVNSDEIRELRAALLQAAVSSFRPAVVLVDQHPFGARGEFRAGLEARKAHGGRAVLGLRDILDEPAVVRREWGEHRLQERIGEFYDRILVYGERSAFDPVTEYGLPRPAELRARFCGYVVNHDRPNPAAELPEELRRACRQGPVVLATTGGGEDGFALLEAFIAAAAGAPWRGVAIAGPMTPEDDLALLHAQAARAGVILHPFIPRLPTLFASLETLVCMGGYNTLVEAALHAVPTVCVPRVAPRSEQLIRARAFQRLGLLRLLHPGELDPASLAAAIGAMRATPRAVVRERVEGALNFDGARVAAQELLALARAESPVSAAPAVAAR